MAVRLQSRFELSSYKTHNAVNSDFAGNTNIFSQTCTGVCYDDYVVGNGTNYDNAYFEVASVRVFSKQGTNTVVSDNSAGTARVATFAGVVLGAFTILALTAL